MGIMPGWENLSDDTKTALIMAGATTAAGVVNTLYDNEQNEDARRDAAIGNRAEGINEIARGEREDFQFGQNQNDNRAIAASKMAGTSPLQHQSQRAQFAATGDFLGGKGRSPLTGPAASSGVPSSFSKYMPSGGVAGAALPASTLAFFSPGAMANAEGNWWANQANLDPRLPTPDLSKVGYGDAGGEVTSNVEGFRQNRLASDAEETDAYNAQARARREALLAALAELGPDSGAEERAGGDGGIDWKKWGLAGAGLGAAYLGGRYA